MSEVVDHLVDEFSADWIADAEIWVPDWLSEHFASLGEALHFLSVLESLEVVLDTADMRYAHDSN